MSNHDEQYSQLSQSIIIIRVSVALPYKAIITMDMCVHVLSCIIVIRKSNEIAISQKLFKNMCNNNNR